MIHRQPLVRVSRRRADDEALTYPFNSLVDALRHRAEETPDAVAFDFDDGALTFKQLLGDAEDLAQVLFVRGVDRGGRCALILETGVELVRFIVATQMLGAAPAVINPTLAASAIIRRVRDVRAEVAVAGERLLPSLTRENERVHGRARIRAPEEIRSNVQSSRTSNVIPSREDLASIVLSAGSDGETHGITLKQRQVIAWTNTVADHLGLSVDDVLASHLPFFIGTGIAWFVFLPLVVGCRSVHRPFPDRAPERWLRSVAEHKPSIMVGNDTFLRVLAGARFWETIEIGSLRAVVSYGEPPRQTSIGDFESRFGLDGVVRPGYGLCEAIGAVAIDTDDEILVDRNGVVSSGRAMHGMLLRVVGKDGADCPAGEPGEIVIQGDAVFQSYFDQPALTAERLRDGWLHTGDLAYLDDNGKLFVLGRDSEIIRLAERSLLPRQVEEAGADVQNVEALAAIGRPAPSGNPNDPEALIVVAEVSRLAREDREQMTTISDALTAAIEGALRVAPDEVLLAKPGILPRTADGRLAYARLRDTVISGRLGREGAILHGSNVFISPLKR